MLVTQGAYATTFTMLRAIGVMIVLWYLSSLFSHSFQAADGAFTATFKALEAAAQLSTNRIELQ